MIDFTIFAERLKEYMDERDLNCTSLAKAVGMNRTSVSEFVRGVRLPSFGNFTAIIEYFNCSADYLLGKIEFAPDENTVFKPVPPFGGRFRQVLKFCGCTQYRLEKYMGFSPSAVYCWLSGKKLPSVECLERLSDKLNVSIDFLLGRV